MFENKEINLHLLRERAFNLRWASVEKDVIPLTAADPDFPCAPQIIESINKYIRDRYFSYAPAEGYSFFREAMVDSLLNQKGIPANSEFIYPVDSAAFGIFNVCKAFLNKDDEAIIFNPVDFLFKYSIEKVGGRAIDLPVSLNPEVSIDLEKLSSLITPKTKLLCLCNPLNPTGKVFTKQELTAIGKIAVKHNIIILSDEIWSDIVFSPSSYVSVASLDEEIRNQTVIVTGFSKSYGLAGLRIGAVVSFNDKNHQTLFEASDHKSTIHGSNVLAQVAATTALNECDQWLNQFVTHLHKMREIVVSGLNNLKGVSCYYPQGCYVAFANISATGYTSEYLHALLLKEAKVAIVPGLPKWFGSNAEGNIRISFATSEELLTEAMNRIKKTINNL